MAKSINSEELETMLDQSSLGDILAALAEIANEKADHLRSNWQDDVAAKSWERDAAKLDKLTARLEN
jgi:hypothetical protein